MQRSPEKTGGWVLITGDLPHGVARAWQAVIDSNALAGIFEVMEGGTFMLTYHVAGDPKATVERFGTFAQAQERAGLVLSTRMVVGRPIARAA